MGIVDKFLDFIFKKFIKCHVFISYKNEDIHYAKAVSNFLKSYFVNVFIAPIAIETGKDPHEIIKSNIDGCDIFIPIFSSRTIKSSYTHQEIGYAIRSDKEKIFPIVIGKMKKKDMGMLATIQYVEFSNTNKWKSELRGKILRRYTFVASLWIIVLIAAISRIIGY